MASTKVAMAIDLWRPPARPPRKYVDHVQIQRSLRDWLADACVTAVAGVLGGLVLLGALAEDPAPPGWYVYADVTIGAVAAGALLARRRWPVALALALTPVAVLSPMAVGAAAMAIFTVAVHRPWRVAITVAAAHAATLLAVWRVAIDDPRAYWEAVTVVLAVHVALVAVGMLVRSQRMLVRAAEDRARQAEEGQRLRVEEARHLERERIAREMHDVLAHRISLLAVHAGALEVRRTAPADERHAAGIIRQAAYDALEDLRAVIGMLRDTPETPDAQRPQPTLSDLDTLIEDSRRAGTSVRFDNRIVDLGARPDGVGRHVYRVVQEGLTNARKHAPGAPVQVALDTCPDGRLTVAITNPLPDVRVPPIPGTGTGLVGLGERMDLIGGRLEHGVTPAGDFRLQAWLPWPS